MWNLSGLVPESSVRLLAAVLLVALGAGGCGPSGDSAVYTIVFALGDSPEDLAKLSFRVVYDGGSFSGNGTSVSCDLVSEDDDETATFTDDDDDTLEAVIDAEGNPLSAGSAIVNCSFEASQQPTSANFTVTVVSAEDEFGDPVNAADVDVVVTETDLAAAATASVGEITE